MNDNLETDLSSVSNLWKIIEARDRSVAVSRERFSSLNYEYQSLFQKQDQLQKHQQEQIQSQQEQIQELHKQLQEVYLSLGQVQSYAKTLEVQTLQLRSQSEQLQSQLSERQSRIDQLRADKKKLGDRLQKAKLKISNLQQQVEAMQSSKFWKLRTAWVSLKNRLRLNS